MRTKMDWKRLCKRFTNGGAVPTGDGSNAEGGASTDKDSAEPSESEPKTFTQEEVSHMMAKEKREGRQSVLNELGVENLDTAKNSLAEYKKIVEAQKTEAQKAADAQAELNNKLVQAQRDKQTSDAKLQLLIEGCNKDNIDEALVLVMAKISDSTDFSEAIKQVKEKLPLLFEDASSQNKGGTGSPVGHNRNKPKEEGTLASRLAKSALANTPEKNPYFLR